MTRVRLIVTGDLEKKALGRSLERCFQAVGADVSFSAPLLLSNAAMTTNPLPDPNNEAARTPSTVKRMARALVTETIIGPSRHLPDLVIGVDDLELANAHQPQVVTAWVRRAVHEEVEARFAVLGAETTQSAEAKRALRERCSFHLLVPLAETYFFGEGAALTRAGVRTTVPVCLVGTDVESFETNDPVFLPRATQENAQKVALGHHFWREERHPKRYLEFLLEQSDGFYQETVGGVLALEELDWVGLGTDPTAVQFSRALFEDVADLLGIANPLGVGGLSEWTYPSRAVRQETLTLRNL